MIALDAGLGARLCRSTRRPSKAAASEARVTRRTRIRLAQRRCMDGSRLLIDPRLGDAEDDIASTKSRSLVAIGGRLLAEISLPKLLLAWIMLIGLPAILLGLAPLVVLGWATTIPGRVAAALAGFWSLLIAVGLVALAWFGGRPVLRVAEQSFWSLNALAIQPIYALFREGLRHIGVKLAPDLGPRRRTQLYAAAAIGGGILVSALSVWCVTLAWPASRWVGDAADLMAPLHLIVPVLANAVVIVGCYVMVAALVWALADGAMGRPADLMAFDEIPSGSRTWRVAHLSDLHVVGERYGFRIESGRTGPQGNERVRRVLDRLEAFHDDQPLDLILITGDMTDAGRSAEWAEFLDAVAAHPRLAERILILPGNHDVNVVDRANPARLELPTSPGKRLRQLRTLSAIEALQGDKALCFDSRTGRFGPSVTESLRPYRDDIDAFADLGGIRLSHRLVEVWDDAFPMIVPPSVEDGLGVVLLNSNAEAHFSFTNALGIVSVLQAQALDAAMKQYPARRMDRGAPSPSRGVSHTGKSILRAHRDRSHQWILVRAAIAAPRRTSDRVSRSPAYRMDRTMRRRSHCLSLLSRDGPGQERRGFLLRSYPRSQ